MTERKKIMAASLWVLGAFSVSQLLRLGGNLIVTRLLVPEMFGIMAIVYVVIQGLAMFSDLGLRAYIIRHNNGADPNTLNTIWTMQVLRGWFMFTVVALIALLLFLMNHVWELGLGEIYGNHDLPLILLIIGSLSLVGGYQTMAPILMDRELNRGKIELIGLLSQFLATLVMILLAWHYHSIWALVFAAITGTILNTLFTYKLFPQVRHQLAWDKDVVSDVFNFGKWIVFATALTYLAQQGDKLIFSAYLTAAELGVYSIAFMLSGVVTNIFEQLASKIWFPALSRVANNKPMELKQKYYEIRTKLDIAMFSIIGITIAISPKLIDFLYDERFHEAGWMIQILSIGIIGGVISRIGIACLMVLGQTKIRMKIMFIRTLGLFIGLPIGFHYFGISGAIWAVAINSFIAIPAQYVEMYKQNIFSLVLELRMLPVFFLAYWLSNILIIKVF